MSKLNVVFIPVLVIGISLISGCKKSPFTLVPVSGTVTLDGQPLAGGIVSFQPIATQGDQSGPGSAAVCDEAGKFQLKTQAIDAEEGAVLGEHRIRISLIDRSPPDPERPDEDAGPVQEQVPEKYNLKTELTFTVPAGGTDAADFDLER